MFARALSGTVSAFEGRVVHVEVDISRGLPMFDIVGLPDASMRESRDRVRAALRNSGLAFPTARIVVNLAPADMPKSGPASDLAIALGVLAAAGQLPTERLSRYCVVGELSLDGAVYSVPGLLPVALTAAKHGLKLLTASRAAAEAALVPGLAVVTVETLRDAVEWFRRGGKEPEPGGLVAAPKTGGSDPRRLDNKASAVVAAEDGAEDLADVKGQSLAKRAVEIAAAGEHNLFFVGPPGVGKTMLARRLPGVLPPLSREEHLDVCRVYSVAGLLDSRLVARRRRPFRAPHHSATRAGMLGGARGVPGEVSLAHHGVLFLDELNEFPRALLEALRQPLEEGAVVLARLPKPVRFPARFTFVAAANPCPCGYYGDDRRECRCRGHGLEAYRGKLSGPLADRLDLFVEMRAPTWGELAAAGPPEATSEAVRERVVSARRRQRRRFGGRPGVANGRLPPSELRRHCRLEAAAEGLLQRATDALRLSARGVHRTLRVARTIADLAGADRVGADHVQEALAFRSSLPDSSPPPSPHMHWRDAGGDG